MGERIARRVKEWKERGCGGGEATHTCTSAWQKMMLTAPPPPPLPPAAWAFVLAVAAAVAAPCERMAFMRALSRR